MSASGKFIKRPDDKALKQSIDQLRAEIKKLDESNNEITSQISKLQIDQKILDEKTQLNNQLKSLIAKQSNLKTERNSINDQIKSVENSMKKRIAEIQQQTSKNNFKSVGEIDQRITNLDNLIDSGDLKLADERKYVKEMSSLRKLRKDFGAIEKIQQLIDQDKLKITELKKKLNSTHNKELNNQFETIQKKLDEINSSNKTIISKRDVLYNKRNEIKKQKDEKYNEIRTLKKEFDDKFANFKKQLDEKRKQEEEEYKKKAENEKQERRKKQAEKELADASIPAFTEEIASIHTLLSYFDPTYVKPVKAKKEVNGKVPTNSNSRTIEFPQEFVVVKKEQEDFFSGSKGKKQNKSNSKKKQAKNFTVAPEIVVALSDLTIAFPTKEEDVPNTIDVLKETLSALEDKQEDQTKVNIEKAKARIAKLEEEEEDDAQEEEEDNETEN